jgi:hypothetical protein
VLTNLLSQAIRVAALPAAAIGATGTLLPALALVIALQALQNSRQP